MPDDKTIIEKTVQHVRTALEGESSGHDWWHVYRVYKNAIQICQTEKADQTVVSLAALLHDIADYKLHGGDSEIGPKVAREWLEKQGLEEHRIAHICKIINDMSFKGSGTKSEMDSVEGKIVQDADRLDAIGAIGIARVFAFGGNKGREIFNPEIKPQVHDDFESYKSAKTSSINHFYEKLLLLKDLMNTETAKRLSEKRHEFMLQFLKEFNEEWEAN